MFTQEKVCDDVRFTLAATEIAPCLAQQLRLILGALTTHRIAFDILIEQFIRDLPPKTGPDFMLEPSSTVSFLKNSDIK